MSNSLPRKAARPAHPRTRYSQNWKIVNRSKTLIIALEEHVDYWNQEGWIDPYSSAQWTEPQRGHLSKLKSGEVYTPQMIVDGQRQFVGSRELDAEQAIRSQQVTRRRRLL